MDNWLDSFAASAFARSADVAHDLKTPLNIAVLNLELLRMKTRKLLSEQGDDNIAGYSAAIDVELRRMARIFDAFFVYSVPPSPATPPSDVAVATVIDDVVRRAGITKATPECPATTLIHPTRLVDLARFFVDGSLRVLEPAGVETAEAMEDGYYRLQLVSSWDAERIDLTKIFKFYYTDKTGAPDLSLATARLIAETYGGSVEAREKERSLEMELSLRLSESPTSKSQGS